jgi:hypothetical protein
MRFLKSRVEAHAIEDLYMAGYIGRISGQCVSPEKGRN